MVQLYVISQEIGATFNSKEALSISYFIFMSAWKVTSVFRFRTCFLEDA